MRKRTSLLCRTGLLALALAVFVLSGAMVQAATNTAEGEARADVALIDSMAAHGRLELPPVVFPHDKHTEALKAARLDCSACHNPVKEGGEALSFAYKNADSLRGDDLKGMFHQSCIGCHKDMKGSGKTGPLEAECRSCHKDAPQVSGWNPIGFDNVLHYRHVASKQIAVAGQEKNCGACHHVFDAEAKKLVWGENKEDSCRACHMSAGELAASKAVFALKKAEDDSLSEPVDQNGPVFQRPTLDQASHQSCVNCHRSVTANGGPEAKSGPDTCAGCHGATALAALAEASAKVDPASVPRLERGQDDVVYMLPTPAEGQQLKGMMRPVAFNHKFHEGVTPDCRTCHHKRISACSDCHTFEGKPGESTLNWASAMHRPSSERSCVGCHARQAQKPSCVGCHAVTPQRLSANSCAACHNAPLNYTESYSSSMRSRGNDLEFDPQKALALSKEERKELAERAVSERDGKSLQRVARDNVPEKALIGLLVNEFEASDLPHGKIVDKLVELQKDNRLAVVFHQEAATLCQGCHHNSPASATPPKCVACHGQGLQKPGGLLSLKAAYHQQCITCHEGMNQKPAAQDCAGCHKTRTR